MDDRIYVKYGLLDGKVNVRSRYQWDHGVQINVTGMPTTNLAYIEFANEHMTESIRPESTIDESGTMTCMIPDSLFMMPYPVIGYVILADDDSMVTAMSIVIPVTPRAKPADYTCSPDEVIRFNDLVNKLNLSIQEVNELKKAVETATGNADTATQNANTAASKINNMTVSATTLTQGSDASVNKTDDGKKISLAFGIPRGDTGLTPDITMNANTGDPGTDVKIEKSGTAENPNFKVTIPRGDTGASGVYVGSDTPTDPEINVWIDPEGNADYDTVVSVNGITADDEGNIQLGAGDVGALPSGGTATNASKLGNKSPDFYGHPLNWLHNSDFTNPINYRGLSSYTGQVYGIDRWYGRVVAQTVDVRSTDVTVTATSTSYVGIKQKVGNFGKLAGKTVTLAARVYSNVVPQILFVDSSGNALAEKKGTAGSEQTLVLSYTLPSDTVSENVIPTIQVRTTASGDYIRIYWAALYEGSYTTDTIPTYVPKDRIVEMICCGVPLHPHNLLDNSYFLDSVNQRGASSVTADWGYIIDRWYCSNVSTDAPVSIGTNGLTLNNTNGTNTMSVREKVPNVKNGSYTVVAKVGDSIGTFYFTIEDGTLSNMKNNTNDIWKFWISVENTNTVLIFLQAYAGKSATFSWAALYYGHYDADMIPGYQLKGYAAELAECQRYYQVIPDQTSCAFSTSAQSDKYFASSIAFRPMRIVPTVTMKTDSDGYIGVVQGVSFVSKSEFDFAYKLNGTLLPATTNANYAGLVMSLYGVELNADL